VRHLRRIVEAPERGTNVGDADEAVFISNINNFFLLLYANAVLFKYAREHL